MQLMCYDVPEIKKKSSSGLGDLTGYQGSGEYEFPTGGIVRDPLYFKSECRI